MDNNEMMNNEPVQEAPAMAEAPVAVEVPETVAPKKSKGPLIAIIALAVVVVLAIAGVLAWKFGLFLKPADKVLIAAKNTFTEKDTIGKALGDSMKEEEAITTKFEGEFDRYSGDLTMMVDKTGYGFEANVHLPELPTISGVMRLDADSLRLKVPAVLDQVFVYDYHKVNENSLITQNAGGKEQIEAVNKALQQMVDSCAAIEGQKEKTAELEGKLLEVYRELPFEKAEAAEWTVNGEKKKCDAYTTTLDTASQQKIWDILKDYSPSFDPNENQAMAMIEKSEDVKFVFYLNDSKFAAVEMTAMTSGEKVTVTFEGGETAWQNLAVATKDGEVFRMSGKTEGTKENLAFSVQGNELGNFDFDAADNSYAVNVNVGGSISATVGGTITSSKDEFKLTIDKIESGGAAVPAKMTMTMTPGAEMPAVDGEQFDVVDAEQKDWMGLAGKLIGSEIGQAIAGSLF